MLNASASNLIIEAKDVTITLQPKRPLRTENEARLIGRTQDSVKLVFAGGFPDLFVLSDSLNMLRLETLSL